MKARRSRCGAALTQARAQMLAHVVAPAISAIVSLHAAGCVPPEPIAIEPIAPPGLDIPSADVIALAGADLVVIEGTEVTLDGSASRALDGEASLAWAQLAGPSVVLDNASSRTPRFVAPLAPATLRFRLHAAVGVLGDDDVVEVRVVGPEAPDPLPAFLVVPADARAVPGEVLSFDVASAGASTPVITVRAGCRGLDAAVPTTLDGTVVTMTVPDALPCVVVVDGTSADGRSLAPAARVLWPADGALVPATTWSSPVVVDPDAEFAVAPSVEGGIRDAMQVRVWSASGDGLAFTSSNDGARARAPRRAMRLAIASEVRLGGATSGVHVDFVDVTAGIDNVAPVAHGGADLRVRPEARFRIDARASSDADRDALRTDVRQVLGANAQRAAADGDVFLAPSRSGELLFHVVADDGSVTSRVDTVRVTVADDVENLPPELAIAPLRHVVPGASFTLDISGARDPDSGLIAAYRIEQDPNDDELLLTEGVDQARVTLTAGDSGRAYHFTLSAFDAQGLGSTADVTVNVEEAGPYVDPVRGDDATGNGTAQRPFATVAGAVPTAARHEFSTLLLTSGVHDAPITALPDEFGLQGGFAFDGAQYVPTDGYAELTFADGLVLHGVSLRGVDVATDGVRCDRTVEWIDAHIHGRGVAASEGTQIDVQPGASLRLVRAHVEGSVACAQGAVFFDHTQLRGHDAPLRADACTVELADSALLHDVDDSNTLDATDAAVTLQGGLVRVGPDARIEQSVSTGAALAPGVLLRALVLDGDANAIVRGTVATHVQLDGDQHAIAIAVTSGRIEFAGARVQADGGQSATGIVVSSGAAQGTASIEVASTRALGVDVRGGDVLLQGARVVTTGTADATGVLLATGALHGDDVAVEVQARDGAASGIVAPSVSLAHATVVVQSPVHAHGITADFVTAEVCDIEASGDDAVGIDTREQHLQRTRVVAIGTNAQAVRAASLDAAASFAHAAGNGAVAAHVDTTARLAHVTLRGDSIALRSSTRDVALHNVVLDAAAPLVAGAGPLSQQVAVAYVTDALVVDAQPIANAADIPGCVGCLLLRADDVSPDGRIVQATSALIDAGVTTDVSEDIEGDAIPEGAAPDIGCDEFVQPSSP